jgi:PKD repeat protein
VAPLEKRELLSSSPAAFHFDFGTAYSPVAAGYTQVLPVDYSAAAGFGWQDASTVTAVSRHTSDALTTDFHRSTDATFLVDVPNGNYLVTPTLGDADYQRDNVSVYGQGQLLASGLTTAAGQFVSPTYQVDVTNGQLSLRFVDGGGATPRFALDGLDIVGAPTVNAGPDQTVSEGTKVAFDGSATPPPTAPGASPSNTPSLSYTWDFGDGTTAAGTLTPKHTYNQGGTYTVTLTATDSLGTSSQDTTAVTVNETPPTVQTGGPYSGTAGAAVTFTATATDPDPADTAAGFTYTWNFGDGATSNQASTSHTYNTAGTYTVTVQVSDTEGQTTTATTTATINTVSQGATYYVSPTGSNSNSGTQAQPFRTIAYGASFLQPGDTLYLRAGTYSEALINNIPGGSSWDEPVTIAAYPGEAVTVRPPKGSTSVVYLSDQTRCYIVFDGLVLDAVNVDADAVKITWGSSTGASNHIRFSNCEIENAVNGSGPQQGVLITNASGENTDNNEFINCQVHDNGKSSLEHGFYIESSYNLIQGCDVYNNAGYGIQVYKGGGVNGQDASYNTICDSAFHDNSQHGNSGNAGIGLFTGDGNVAYNDLVWNNPRGIAVGYGATNTDIYNNTVYNNTGNAGIDITSSSTGAVVENNIAYHNGNGNYSDAGTGTTQDHNLFTKDPQFVDAANHNFHLQSTSPAINAGITIALVTTDYDGVSRPQGGAYDIGAFEYVS